MKLKSHQLLSFWMAWAKTTSAFANASVSLPSHPVAHLPSTWFENLAVRSNGNILLTTCHLPDASVFELTDPGTNSSRLSLLFTIPSVNCLLGITETSPDVFAFVGSNISLTEGGSKGASALWRIDFNDDPAPRPTLKAELPEAILLNGATSIPENPRIVLIADSILGLVWRVDTDTGNVTVGVQVPGMGSGQCAKPVTAINGLKIREGHLWWTNFAQGTLYRVKITKDGNVACGATVEKMTTISGSVTDDFTFGPGGGDIAWVATNKGNKVFAVRPNGESVSVSDAAEVAGVSAARFGRMGRDSGTLYVTTTAGYVVAIDTTSFFEKGS